MEKFEIERIRSCKDNNLSKVQIEKAKFIGIKSLTKEAFLLEIEGLNIKSSIRYVGNEKYKHDKDFGKFYTFAFDNSTGNSYIFFDSFYRKTIDEAIDALIDAVLQHLTEQIKK